MAIVRMNKFTLLLFEEQKQKLLEELQSFEGVQFINLQEESELHENEELDMLMKDSTGEEYAHYEKYLSELQYTLDTLKPYLSKRSGIKNVLEEQRIMSISELLKDVGDSDWQSIYDALKAKEELLNILSNEKTRLITEIVQLDMWKKLDINLSVLKSLKYVSYIIGTLAKQNEEPFMREYIKDVQLGYLEVLNRDNENIYLLCLYHNEEADNAGEVFRNFGLTSITLNYEGIPGEIIDEHRKRIKDILTEEKQIQDEIREYSGYYDKLLIVYEYYNNILVRLNAVKNFLKTDRVVSMCGWIATEDNEHLKESIEKAVGKEYYLNFSQVTEEESNKVPIKLRNNAFASSFEGIVEMYSMPGYSEVDPTPVLSIFYFIFFGMMLSDAGYGLIMAAASAVALSKLKSKEKRKSLKLFFYAGISTIIWGAIYGGWFGDLLPKYFGIKVPYLLDPADSIIQIFLISLAFGVIHIFIGLGLKAYMLLKSGKIKDAVYDVLTWYAALIGAFLLLVGIGGSVGTTLFAAGIAGLLLTQGRQAASIGGKIGGGIYGVYGITGYLGDIVSYSRLLALGLATGFIANALNLIVSLIPSPLSYILAPVMFLGLHAFNLTINALGSYVHAARLQYLEFFSKFYEGGGNKFIPFKLSDKYIKITK